MRKNEIELAVSTDILSEYEEVFERKFGRAFSQAVLDALTSIENLRFVTKYYFWQAIPKDPDDEKFHDCAIVANADYLVTDDRHFQHLKKGQHFPPLKIVTAKEFKHLFLQSKHS